MLQPHLQKIYKWLLMTYKLFLNMFAIKLDPLFILSLCALV